jgi:hypothetical protein
MVMRYRGRGVGHKPTWAATECLAEDLDPLDEANRMETDEVHEGDEGEEALDLGQTDGRDSDEDSLQLASDQDSASSESEEGEADHDISDEEGFDEFGAEGYAEP